MSRARVRGQLTAGKSLDLSSSYKKHDHLFKLLICGISGVGKTCVLCRYVDNEIRKIHIVTKHIDFKVTTVETRGKKIRLQIWDTAGQERYETLTMQYFRKAQGVLLTYDITNWDSFYSLSRWLQMIKEKSPPDIKIVLLGNKLDIEGQRVVSTAQGQEFARQNGMQFFETSSYEAINITEAISVLVEDILDQTERIETSSKQSTHALSQSKSLLDNTSNEEDTAKQTTLIGFEAVNKDTDKNNDQSLLKPHEDSITLPTNSINTQGAEISPTENKSKPESESCWC